MIGADLGGADRGEGHCESHVTWWVMGGVIAIVCGYAVRPPLFKRS